jgi:hypothetical protein
MLKRIMIGAVVLILISAFGTVGYAIDDETILGPDSVDNQEIIEEENDSEKDGEEIQDTIGEESSIEIISPEDNFTTSETTILLSGNAKEGSIITVDVYSVKSVEQISFPLKSESEEESSSTESNIEVNIQLKGKPSKKETTVIKEEYEHQYSKTFEVGELGFFAEELELKEGKNKIAICLQKDDKIQSIIIRYVTVTSIDAAKKELEQIGNENFLDTLKKVITPEEQLNSEQ